MFRRSAHAQKLSRERNFAQLRNTYHSIRLDELNQNLPSAHRLVEISTRYRVLLLLMRSCAIRRPILRSSRIQMQLVETNLTTCVSSLGDASFQRYRCFRRDACAGSAIRSCRACAVVKQRYLGNEASPSDETHLIRFVSTFCT